MTGLGEQDAGDLWETHSDWWQEEFTDGADPEYTEQILPLAVQLLDGYERVLDLGCGEGQIARLVAVTCTPDFILGVDPTPSQISTAIERGTGLEFGQSEYVVGGASALGVPDDTFDAVVACLVFEHIDPLEPAIAEVSRVLEPGGRFVLFLNHPLLQTPGSGWIDDHMAEPAEQYWRIGPYLVEASLVEEVQKDVFIPFVHRPLSRYVNALSGAGLRLVEMHEPAPPEGFLDKSPFFAAAAHIPRLLVMVCEREADDG